MAANKVATLIHRKTNRITLVLVYAFLEWTLIFFLLLNSLFSYLILKFADFFGLKRPCLLCSRLDHSFDPSGKSSSYGDLLCDDHALEISRLGFCYSHRRVAKSRDLCQDCSSSDEYYKDFACFPWMDHKVVEPGEADWIKCCPCCGASVKERALIDPHWGILDYTQKGKASEQDVDERIQIPVKRIRQDSVHDEEKVGSVDLNHNQKENWMREKETEERIPFEVEQWKREECRGIQIVPEVPEEEDEVVNVDEEDETGEEFSCFISSFDCNNEVNIPENHEEPQRIDVIESCISKPTEAVSKHLEFFIDGQDCHLIPVEFIKPGKVVQEISDGNGDVILDFNYQAGVEAEADFVVEHRQCTEETVGFVSSNEPKQSDDRMVAIKETEEDLDCWNDHHTFHGSSDDLLQTQNDEETDDLLQTQNGEETDAEISIGTEIPDHEQVDDDFASPENASTEEYNEQGEEMLEFRTVTIEDKKPVVSSSTQLEEEKVLETPSLIDSLDRKESGTEDSLDSVSVTSEIECSDGGITIEKLKSALREERKALNSLYAELEEERSASAVAANQTMAMINRLQEEKAAMQMEALQYQRMMEEQSEYDQEALQLLNELVVKREKEKAELEKELEVYRKRVVDNEEKEKMGILRRRDSCGSSEDMSQETKKDKKDNDRNIINFDDDDDGAVIMEQKDNTPVDAVICLEESLADFEDERHSILEQLKILEEKLSSLNDDEEYEVENGNGHIRENGHYVNVNETNGKHKFLKSKRLLPLFDAAEAEIETENGLYNGRHHENGINHSEKNRIAVEEEVEELYERLQALEADREFLRHCVGSLRKGDKGVYLLQEILQHLRDLRNVEYRVRNAEGM